MATDQKTPIPAVSGFFGGAPETVKEIARLGSEMQKLQDDVDQKIMEINGRKFVYDRCCHTWQELKVPLPDDDPVPMPIKFFTLDGMIDYIRENVEGLIPDADSGERLILQVVNETTVKLYGKPSQNRKVRQTVCYCEAHAPSIEFGRFMELDDFCVMLLTKFVDTDAKAELFKVVRSLTNEQSMQVAEDGVSQVITVKQGVSLASNHQFKNPVPLAPMRTFTEIDQPESNFTLRVDKDADIALFEADGGAWKNEAVARIQFYLKTNLADCPVVVLA